MATFALAPVKSSEETTPGRPFSPNMNRIDIEAPLGEDIPVIEVEDNDGQESRARWERRLSCQEMDSVLNDLRKVMATSRSLPKNEGSVIECKLQKQLIDIGGDAEKTIDDTINSMQDWLENLRRSLKAHVASHHFTEGREALPLRLMDEETRKKRTDSGICSQEVPYNISTEDHEMQIESLKEDQACAMLPEESSSKSDDETTSGDCNQCFGSYDSCECKGLTQEELRREPVPKQGPRRQAIVSFSQLPQGKVQEDSIKTSVSSSNEYLKNPTSSFQAFTETTDLNIHRTAFIPGSIQTDDSQTPITASIPATTKTDDSQTPITAFIPAFTTPVTLSNSVFTQTHDDKTSESASISAFTQTDDDKTSNATSISTFTQTDDDETSNATSISTFTQTDDDKTSNATSISTFTQTDDDETSISAFTQTDDSKTSLKSH
ncbi:hypothetical protein RRG08_032902 [Elysia crispata]|uniref:Uncharacterized protein n=1 Tax=Elysia crispata TaxID=231223 RepID=A0AAE1A723_9GAST|nr:hypothetical protein RRG08_032902 [Elysia crispata]